MIIARYGRSFDGAAIYDAQTGFHFLLVDGGRAYLVQVPGTANAPLDDRSVAELLNWMLERFSGRMRPANFVPYSAEEVADYRREKLANPAARRKALLAALTGA